MRRTIAMWTILALASAATGAALSARDGDDPQQKASPAAAATQAKTLADQIKESKFWMDQKLSRTQNILAGLTRGDYDTVTDNAKALNVLNYLEAYVRSDVPEYKEQLQLFKFANGALIKAARDKNSDAATLAYTQLCISCVNCHNVIRDEEAKK
jgi:hypothetical protein